MDPPFFNGFHHLPPPLCQDHVHLPKRDFFAKLNTKLRGYYHYYGIRGNYERLSDFFYQVQRILFATLNCRSQRKSYNWRGFVALLEHYRLLHPRICQGLLSYTWVGACEASNMEERR